MARKRKNDTSQAIEFVVWILLGLPLAFVYLIKFLISLIGKAPSSTTSISNLSEVDKLDGIEFEYYVAQLLSDNGFKKVTLTKATGDFGVDITAIKDNKFWAFQCKHYRSKLGLKPIQEVYSGAAKYAATKAVVVTNSYFTKNAIELASKLDVELWDRAKLSKLVRDSVSMPPPSDMKENDDIIPYCDIQKNADFIPPKHSYSHNIPPQQDAAQENLVKILSSITPPINSDEQNTTDKRIMGDVEMATILGAGKYVFGEDIPIGKYNLKAISGVGMLQIQKQTDGEWHEEWINFGIEDYCAKTYYGLSLPKNKYFEVTGNVTFEITKSKMIVIE